MAVEAAKWTVDRLADQLRKMGVETGDRLFVHTGLRPMRLARAEVPNLLQAYLRVLGPDGAVYFPTHTYSMKRATLTLPYTLDTPCHPEIGAWPELTRKNPAAVRSMHPTHSAAGIGAGVAETLAGHHKVDPVGEDSPLDRLQRQDAKVLLIGCGFESCTLLHLAEHYARVPYLRALPGRPSAYGLLRRGDSVEEVPVYECPGCSHAFPRMEPELRDAGVVRDGLLGNAPVMVCDMLPLLLAATERFRRNPYGYVLQGECPRCKTIVDRRART